MKKLLILRGLPWAGKSILARNIVDTIHWWKRVNKDDLRAMIDNGKWSEKNEKLIDQCELAIADIYLNAWYNVVIDDWNLSDKRVKMLWENLVLDATKVEVVEHFIDTPVEECIRRDRLRWDKRVWDNIIKKFWKEHLKHD